MLLETLTLLSPFVLQEPLDPKDKAPESSSAWTTSLSTYWYEPPDESGYLSGILRADRGVLHLEAHWAYEDRDTLSLFVGRTIPIEGEVSGAFTPRIGIAGGDSDGVIPAAALDLSWKSLSFTTDVQYLIGTSDDTSDFLYSWSELSWTFAERFSVGLVGQRTNVFDQELTIDRGFLAGVNLGPTYITAYWFNPDVDDPYFSIAIGAAF